MSRTIHAYEAVDAAGNIKKPVTLNYGTMAEQEASAVAITGGTIHNAKNTNYLGGLTAAGSAAGDALALTEGYEIYATSTTASGTGVKLPTGVAGMKVEVFNGGANTLLVYPATGGTISGGSVDAGNSLATKIGGSYRCVAADTWIKV